MITSEKLVGSENYLSWSASVELWFMGQGYEDHLVTQEADIPEIECVQWRKIDVQLCNVLWQSVDPKILLHLRAYKLVLNFGLRPKDYTRMISSVFIRWLLLLSISANRTWIYLLILAKLPLLRRRFLTVMPLTLDVGAQQTQLDKFFMVLTLIGLRSDLESVRDQILGSLSVPSLDDVFARLLLVTEVEANILIAPIANKLGHTRDRCYQLHGRPPRTAHVAQSSDSQLPQPPSSSASQASQASVASVAQPDSGASDHISGNKDLFSSITTIPLLLPTVTLTNGSQTVAKGIGLTLPLPSLPLTSDRSTGKTIGIGRESQGLYHLTSDSSPAVCISTDAPLLIHSRLGHPSLSKFQKMRLNNRAKSPFELVHTDVWGPCRTASTLGFQYFVTFIDDYSRSPFTSFMSHHGILHQSSCAHTPQQNGVAERKNRHLVETARTILLHSNVPFRFWGDAVLTACYLINRMPSSVLHDQIPHFLPPRVFGCTCFVHILTPGQDKLFAKAMKCLFLGYSRLQKGYRCYSLETHRYFISANVYHRRPRVAAPLPFAEAPADSLPIPSASPTPALPSPDDLPIAIRKGWRQAMVDEMAALHSNGTWDLIVLPSGKSTVGCRWVYAVKVGLDGQVDHLKARLVAKGYTQVYGSDYGDTFSLVAKIASVRLLLSMAAMCSWPLYQLDIKNAFLHGDSCRGSLYGATSWFCCSGGVWFSVQVTPFSIWLETISSSMCIYLVVYVDDIVITGSDQDGIQKLKQHLFTHFQTKDLGKFKYFLGIEIAQSSSGVVLSQRKYALNILEETGMLDCKPIDTPIDPNVKLVPGQGKPLGDPGRYRRLVGQGVLYENRGHTQIVGYTDADWAGSPIDRRSTSGYCVFIGGNLISWKSKKQDVVARSSVEAEYRAMGLATCELIWLRHLLRELRFGKDEQMKLICDN
ncbi:Retrovirus-related Pol polyprotein from transposon RE1 [Vitis vinifera]|uniref:Retrovirus-related Pol polyprotein from transposon RE1 n=1 Tax=Vitis vinifera TaxID=29760 RepID=A0A438IXW9_VITVI|nr:Retrovirus-related Pol polyprotein from transposon RE1 [Vitis vinifera]